MNLMEIIFPTRLLLLHIFSTVSIWDFYIFHRGNDDCLDRKLLKDDFYEKLFWVELEI